MTATVIIQFVLAALQALPQIESAGAEVASGIAALTSQLKLFQSENRDPTAAEWAALNAKLTAALAALTAASA